MKSQKNKGFTLIELLVVIAIIGILSSVILVSLNNARTKARDAKRLSDINQIIKAVEMYYNDNGVYPSCSGGNPTCLTTVRAGWGVLSTLQAVPTYISSISDDPINTVGEYGYYYSLWNKPTSANSFVYTGSNQNYLIATRLENSSSPTFSGWDNTKLNYLRGQ